MTVVLKDFSSSEESIRSCWVRGSSVAFERVRSPRETFNHIPHFGTYEQHCITYEIENILNPKIPDWNTNARTQVQDAPSIHGKIQVKIGKRTQPVRGVRDRHEIQNQHSNTNRYLSNVFEEKTVLARKETRKSVSKSHFAMGCTNES